MKGLVIVLLLLIIAFLVFNGRETFKPDEVESAQAVTALPRGRIENIIEAVQAKQPSLMPLETVFINPVTSFQGGDVVNTRMMFYDTAKYSGTQLDIQARVDDSSADILSMTPTAAPEIDKDLNPYTGPVYQSYQEIQKTFEEELKKKLAESRQLPGKEVPF